MKDSLPGCLKAEEHKTKCPRDLRVVDTSQIKQDGRHFSLQTSTQASAHSWRSRDFWQTNNLATQQNIPLQAEQIFAKTRRILNVSTANNRQRFIQQTQGKSQSFYSHSRCENTAAHLRWSRVAITSELDVSGMDLVAKIARSTLGIMQCTECTVTQLVTWPYLRSWSSVWSTLTASVTIRF